MKKVTFAALVALAVSTPAVAQEASPFAGPRVGFELGLADDEFLGSSETSWGVNAGYDADVGGAVIGGTIAYTDVFGDDYDFRELAIGGRVGTRVLTNGLFYGSVAYSDLDVAGLSVDGAKFGVGAEFLMTDNVFVNLETRYGTYDYDVELYQTVVGVGVRF
jgi:outer membrane immunogenic protein